MSDRLIAASAWTAESLKLTMPASVFSRSTECHNQDKVSMSTIEICETEVQPPLQEMCGHVFANYEFLEEDRALEPDLRRFFALIQDRAWSLYE
jgi:histidine ammonia-lyase